jgi:hypothetical protein
MNRRFQQPLTLLPEFYRGVSIQVEAMAQAVSVDGLFERLEREEVFLRVDPGITPTMFRGAIVSEAELTLLRRIEDVVRLGKVRRIEPDQIVLDGGRVPTTARTLHVHCAAQGLAYRPPRPVFEPGRVTLQPVAWGFVCYQFAMLGVVEATVDGDDEKNRLCPAVRYWDSNEDFLAAFLAGLIGDRARARHAPLAAWMKATRLNPAGGVAAYRDDRRVIEARDRIKRFGPAAAQNLTKLLAASRPPAGRAGE